MARYDSYSAMPMAWRTRIHTRDDERGHPRSECPTSLREGGQSDDQAALANVELMVRERLEKMGKEGEFYPAEEADTHQ